MACTIESITTVDGKPSILFKELKGRYSDEVALLKYVNMMSDKDALVKNYGKNSQGDPKLSSENRVRYKDEFDGIPKKQVMDLFATYALDVIKSLPKIKDNTTVLGINTKKLNEIDNLSDKLIVGIRNRVKNILLDESVNLSLSQAKVLVNTAQNISSYLVQKDVNDSRIGRPGPVGRRLKEFGILFRAIKMRDEIDAVSVDPSDLKSVEKEYEKGDASFDLLEVEIQRERVYGLDVTETAMTSSITEDTAGYLKQFRQVSENFKYEEGKPISYETNEMNSLSPVNYGRMYSAVGSSLRGVLSVEDMMNRLRDTVKHNPIVAPLYADLLAEQAANKKNIMIDGREASYFAKTTAIFTSFANADYGMVTVVKQKSGTEDVVLIPADRGNVIGMMKADLANNAENVDSTSKKSKDAVIDITKVTIPLMKESTFATKKNDANTTKTSYTRTQETLFKKMRNQYALGGFTFITVPVIKQIIETIKTNPPENLIDTGKPLVSTVFKKLFTGGPLITLKGGSISTTSDNFKNQERKVINFALREASKLNFEQYGGAFLDNSLSMKHPFNKSSESLEIFPKLRTNADLVTQFEADPMYTDSLLLKEARDNPDGSTLTQHTLNTTADSREYGSGLKYGKHSSFDAINARIVGFLTKPEGSNKDTFHALSPTFADRGTGMYTTVKTLNTVDGVSKPVLAYTNKIPRIESPEIKAWIRNQIKGELSRIIKQRNKTVKYKNYSKENNGKIMLFSDLNESLDLNKLTAYNLNSFLDKAMVEMDTIFPAIIENDIKSLQENKILSENQKFVPNERIIHYKTNRKTREFLHNDFKNPTRGTVENFVANNLIYTYEQILFYAGDPAFFKGKGKNIIDLNKRLGLSTTPGVKPAVGEGTGLTKNYNLKVVNDPTFTANNKALFEKLFKDDIYNEEAGFTKEKLYAGIEHADGQTMISLPRYRALLLATSKHDNDTLSYIDKLMAWDPTKNSTVPANPNNVRLPPMKSFSFQFVVDADGTVVPVGQKHSVVPVIPHYFEQKVGGEYKHSGMAAISKELRSKDPKSADEVSMSSAVKVGITGAVDISGLETAKSIVLSNKSYRFPQLSKEKEDIKTRFGSQIRKLVAANVGTDSSSMVMFNGKVIQETTALKMYENALMDIISNAGNKVENTYIKNGELDKGSVVDALLNSIDSGDIFNNPEFFYEALAIEDGETYLPINHPTFSNAVDAKVHSDFKNEVNRFKLPGYQAVQITSMGMLAEAGNGELETDSDLKFVDLVSTEMETVSENGVEVTRNKKLSEADVKKYTALMRDGKGKDELPAKVTVSPAEIRVTEKYFLNAIKQSAVKSVDRRDFNLELAEAKSKLVKSGMFSPKNIEEKIEKLKAHLLSKAVNKREESILNKYRGKDGVLEISKIPQSLLETVLYRIPTQGKSSALPAKIVGFLPNTYGSTIQVPAEIVEQSGSDFDIDKVFIQTRNIDFDAEGNMSRLNFSAAKYQKVEKVNEMLEGFDTVAKSVYKAFGAKNKSEQRTARRLYEDHLNKVYPNSTTKSVMYHGSKSTTIEKFLAPTDKGYKQQDGTTTGANGIYFTNVKSISEKYQGLKSEVKKGRVYPVLLNTVNPLIVGNKPTDGVTKGFGASTLWNIENGIKNGLLKAGFDSIKTGEYATKFASAMGANTEVAILNPDQAYILGGKEDINKFKNYLEAQNISTEKGKSTANTQLTDVNDIREVLTKDIPALAENSKISDDESSYIIKIEGKNEKFSRVSDEVYEVKPEESDLLKTSNVIGNKVDDLFRDYFDGTPGTNVKSFGSYLLAGKAEFNSFVKQLDNLQAHFAVNGETVISNNMLVHDVNSKVAGTIDLITYDKSGKVRIYDVKTMRKNAFEMNEYGELPYDSTTVFENTGNLKEDGTPQMRPVKGESKDSKRTSHAKQLSAYRIALFNTYGILAEELYIVPVKVDYEANSTTSSTLNFLGLEKMQEVISVGSMDLKSIIAPAKPVTDVTQSKEVVFDFMQSILSSPNHMTDLLMPTNTTQMEKAIAELGIKTDADTSNMASIDTQLTLKENNQKGKDLISIFSLAATSKATAAHIGLQLREQTRINGKVVNLSRELTLDGKFKISNILKELQDAALDNANKPLHGYANIGENTAGVISLLISSGHSLKYAIAIVNAPIIKEWSRLYSIANKITKNAIAREVYINNELDKMFSIAKVNPKAVNSDISNYSEAQAIKNMNADESLQTAYSTSQVEAFEIFKNIKKIADDFGSLQTTMNFDSSGPATSAAGVLGQMNNLSRVSGTLAHANNPAKAEEMNMFKIDNKRYKEHSLSAYERYSIHSVAKVDELSSLVASKVGKELLAQAERAYGKLGESQQLHLLKEFETFVFQNSSSLINSKSWVSEYIQSGKHYSLIKNDGSRNVARQIERFRIKESAKETKNEFVKQLRTVSKDKFTFVTFDNTKIKALTESDKTEIMDGYRELMESGNKADNILAKSLAEYAFVFYGFARSKFTFMELLPPAAHVEYGGSKAAKNNPAEFFREFKKATINPTRFNSEYGTFLDMYAARNPEKVGVQKYSDNDIQVIEAMGKTPPRYRLKFNNSTKENYTSKLEDGKYVALTTTLYPEFMKVYDQGMSQVEMAKKEDTTKNIISSTKIKSNVDLISSQIKEKIVDTANTVEDLQQISRDVGKKISTLIGYDSMDIDAKSNLDLLTDIIYMGDKVTKGRTLKTKGLEAMKDGYMIKLNKLLNDASSKIAVDVIAQVIKKC